MMYGALEEKPSSPSEYVKSWGTVRGEKLSLDYTEVNNAQDRLKLKIYKRNMALKDYVFKEPSC